MNSRAEIRKTIRSKRQSLSSKQQQQAAIGLLSQLTRQPKIQRANKIAIYLSNDGELDTHLFIEWCWQQNKQLYLPVIHPFCHGNLLFLRYSPNTTMVKNAFDINEPKLNVTQVCPVNALDIIFTPLVAFDKTGARLGMGGGFYDRTLASWHQQTRLHATDLPIKPHPIGLAHDCQQVDKIPNEHWDIPIPEILTPTQRFNTNNGLALLSPQEK